jgi:uncharacterized membrane protein
MHVMISTTHFHPMLVHFPIALVAFGFIAEIAALFFKKEICLHKVGLYLLIFGTLSALLAWTTGILFTAEMAGSAGEIKDTHELFAWITLGTLIATSAIRIFLEIKNTGNTFLERTALILYGFAAIFVSITGFYGGTLVYNYMMSL